MILNETSIRFLANPIFVVFMFCLAIFFEGLTALSEFHAHFADSLQTLTRKCVSKRDELMKQLLEAKDGGLNETAASTANDETLNTFEQGGLS